MLNDARLDLRILWCAYSSRSHWNWDHLAAPYWRLYWNRIQNGVVRYQGQEIAMSADSMFLITPDTDYDSRGNGPIEQLYIHFVAGHPLDAPPPGILALPQGPETTALAQILIEGTALGTGLPVMQLVAGHALCAWALTHVPRSWVCEAYSDEVIAGVDRFMSENLHRPFSNAEFASRAGLGLRTFLRRFREATGESCQERFRRKRIQEACLLLQLTDHSVERIAADCGFCDRHHFSRVFRELRGTPPAAYRRISTHLNRPFEKLPV